jgi:glyoxylase-like metal-dependent hydrolase (beta-lactamase superfamily II)
MSEVAAPEPAPPVVREKPRQIAEGIWVIPDGRVPLVPNIGIVVGERATLVVDTGMGPKNGAHVRRIVDELAEERPLFLTLTHFHPEHGYGAQAFADRATIVYNQQQLLELRDKGEPYLDMFRTFGEAVAEQLEGTDLVEPHITYDGTADLYLGGRSASLRTWGLAHTRGDQIVFVPQERVLFTGDLVERDMFAIFPFFPPHDGDVDGDRWIAVLEELERLEPAVVVPGHGDVGDASLLATVREYLQQLRVATVAQIDSGKAVDEAVAAVEEEFVALHPDWAQPEWIAFGVRCYYARLT